ncbi:hypothetical protein T552_00006 [Pneumocystis carinii B80]|uniref:Rad26-like C-terminal domain-containing protein n=1 Tax=Pneumocystis carinii (strain B80) TaxID=1408658 RepID=A0A0W4ZSL6_PNEC8|nr:hypothetical protein T552_00006 [Pneumocystis carinii B80]KTW31361.1 hypothetical protein T552_00006 [Pneumocystis carinii B80]
MDFLPLNDSESSSLEDLEPSLLENLDSIELEQLENEAINICSQHYNRNLCQFYINQTDIQDQIQVKYQSDISRDTYEKYPLHLYDQIHAQDNVHRESIQKDISLLNTKNTFYNSIQTDFSDIDKHHCINQWDKMYQSSNMNPRDNYGKSASCNEQIQKAGDMQVANTKETVLQDEITKSQSYIRNFQLQQDGFKVVTRSKSKELAITQTLFDKEQFHMSFIENFEKQYAFSSERHIVTLKKMKVDFDQVHTENRFQKKGLQEGDELITQSENPKKQANSSFNMPFEFPTKKAFESEEKVIDPPVKRKRRLKKYVSLDNAVHEYECITGNYHLKNNENLELQVISKIIHQRMNDNKKLQFIEELFDYRIDYIFKYNDSTIFDILPFYTLPGFSVSVSSMVIKFISRSLTTLNSVLVFLFYLMDYVMVIWKICLEKNYKEPIRHMVSFVHFIFVFQSHVFNELVNVGKIESLLTLLQNTIIEYMVEATKETEVFGYIGEFVVQKCLEILNIIVNLSQENTQITYKISSFLEFNQILLLLNPLHNLLFIKKTLNFLNKSILLKYIQYTVKKDELICFSDCFSKILNIVSRYLTEKYENYKVFELMDLKLEAVTFLNTVMSASVNGKNLLSLNVVVVSQLCRCLAELINFHGTSEIFGQRINLIKSIVFILHEIISPINISFHFAQPWTRYAYIISMTRLSFAEDEDDHGKDIFDDKTIEFARDLLEIVVDPEEGDKLYDLFHISN